MDTTDISDALLDDALQPGFLPDVSKLVSRLKVTGEAFPSELSDLRLACKKHADTFTSGAWGALR